MQEAVQGEDKHFCLLVCTLLCFTYHRGLHKGAVGGVSDAHEYRLVHADYEALHSMIR